ncbi:hypothetical protein OQA88_8118 [Cercophora sp. LCS_1]
MTSPRCEAAIKASLKYLVFDMGRLSIPEDATLFDLLNRSYGRFNFIMEPEDPKEVLSKTNSLEKMLCSIFDTASRALVTETSLQGLAGVDDHDKATLFVQAVAGLAMIYQRLTTTGQPLSSNILSRELQLFSECDQRRNMLEKIEQSTLLNSCFTSGVMTDFVVATIEGRETRHFEDLPLGRLGEDLLSDSVAWVSDRPCKTNGLPWGFTIMALN